MFIKVLLDGMVPRPENIITVELPEGYRRVWLGAICPGDLYLNRFAATAGVIEWRPVEYSPYYPTADYYVCLIRRGKDDPVGTCERCEVHPKKSRHRFCQACCDHIIAEGRQNAMGASPAQ